MEYLLCRVYFFRFVFASRQSVEPNIVFDETGNEIQHKTCGVCYLRASNISTALRPPCKPATLTVAKLAIDSE